MITTAIFLDSTTGGVQATYGVTGQQTGPDVEAYLGSDRAEDLLRELACEGRTHEYRGGILTIWREWR